MFQTVFINTEDSPVEIKRLGCFKYNVEDNNKITVWELCEVFYKHPDAPEHAIVSVYQFLTVKHAVGSDNLIRSTIDAMKGIQSITKLE